MGRNRDDSAIVKKAWETRKRNMRKAGAERPLTRDEILARNRAKARESREGGARRGDGGGGGGGLAGVGACRGAGGGGGALGGSPAGGSAFGRVGSRPWRSWGATSTSASASRIIAGP